ncbi:MAG TPA: hypothetical protein VGO63_03960 [Candidatus Paceibacterota bacterium]|nr:hypothetical protein [Candidatus Paceibacterota bacterium]
MKAKLLALSVALLALIGQSAFAQSQSQMVKIFDGKPALAVVNVGSMVYVVDLDQNLTGSANLFREKEKFTVTLDGNGQISLKIPGHKNAYLGGYDEIKIVNVKPASAKTVAVVMEWNDSDQDQPLDQLIKEMAWRAVHSDISPVVNNRVCRVYVMPEAAQKMESLGVLIDNDKLSIADGSYQINLQKFDGAIIFELSNKNKLIMIQLENGKVDDYCVEKDGVLPVKVSPLPIVGEK